MVGLSVGDKVTLKQRTGDSWVDAVRRPATVFAVKGNVVWIRYCGLTWDANDHYYDSHPIGIWDDPNGKTMKLRWNERRGEWRESPANSYPYIAEVGHWKYEPYLN